jgi:hypothetical protein
MNFLMEFYGSIPPEKLPRPMKIGKFVDNHVLRELLVKKTGANKSNKPSSREWWPTCL